jgi:uncharacterized phosphosugar-binding protein
MSREWIKFMYFVDYIQELVAILRRIAREQAPGILEAGRMVAGAVASGGVVHIFGAGHSHMMAEEAFFRAGGLAAVNPILDERLSFFHGALESTRIEREEGYARTLLSRERVSAGDVGIVVSNSGRNAAPVEMALEMRARGISVIAITNVAQSAGATSRHSSGKRLFEIADVVIDTYVPAGDAVVPMPGLERRVGAASTVAGAAILNSIVIEAAGELARLGTAAPIFPSANIEGATEQTLLELFRPYHDRIRYLDGPEALV